MNAQYDQRACFLRKALLGNALFSTLSGLTILFAQGWVLQILGLSSSVNLLILGVGLIVFAVTLVINARKQQVKKSDAWIAVLMDLAWVVGSYVLIFLVPFSRKGKWVVGSLQSLCYCLPCCSS
jgi:uncharacterized membrane protein HdeD (DUF308 family)